MVSDMMQNKLLSGNFTEHSYLETDRGRLTHPYPDRKRLVEECFSFSLSDLRSIYKRNVLIQLAENGRPAEIRIEGKWFPLYLSVEYLIRSKHFRDTTEITRLWMICPACSRQVRILYTYPLGAESNVLAELKCRQCHNLKYQSQNCGDNIWWRMSALPLKRLCKRQDRLIKMKRTQHIRDELEIIDGQILMLMQRAKPKGRTQRRPGVRRPYRDVNLAVGSFRAVN